jgi:methanogenic corrinoid protein MtbC1
VPTEALRCQIEDRRPDLVGLSAAMVQHLPAMRAAVTMLRGEFGSKCQTIMVGGLGINQVENIWRWVGADIWCADAEKAGQLG